ncbi:MAG: hypothetical protein Q6373_010705 [Candidatus Sigynarchaeota archaeon]
MDSLGRSGTGRHTWEDAGNGRLRKIQSLSIEARHGDRPLIGCFFLSFIKVLHGYPGELTGDTIQGTDGMYY